ncbi:MAG: hypothetical protein JEZ07_15005 [Phycisphaerae bacterium]|nr:hypothetical protein [Phycisphaerae bacterium]
MNYMLPNNPQQSQPSQPQFQPDPQVPEKKKYRFRWPILTVPLTVISFFVFINGAEPAFTFEQMMRKWGIRHPENLIKFACLLLVLSCLLCIVRLFKKKS